MTTSNYIFNFFFRQIVPKKKFPFLFIGFIFFSFKTVQSQDTILKNIINFENPIRSIAKDKKGLIYVQTLEGVFVLSNDKFEKSNFPISNFDRIISHNGKLTTRKLLEKNKIVHKSINQNCDWHHLLPSSGSLNFCQVEVDPYGQIWVSNGSKFIYCFKINNLFKRTISNVSIRGIENHENQLFVLSYSGIYLNGNKWLDELNNGNTNVFKKDNFYWFASTDQVFKLDLRTNKLTVLLDRNKSKEIGEISCVIVFEDKLYIGGFYGLFSIGKAGKLVKENFGKEVNNVTILQDKLFVCAADGIYYLENNIIKKNTKFRSGLVYNDIEERFGKFYAISAEGIWMSDENAPLAKNLLVNTPYENFECFSIEWDEFYHLWIGTAKGLVKYDLNNDEIDVYLTDFEFNKRSSFKIDSKFYFGTTEGLFSFDSKDFSIEEFSYQPKKELIERENGWLFFFILLIIFGSLLTIYLILKTKRITNNPPGFKTENDPEDSKPPFTIENIEVYILKNLSTITAESLREDSGMSKNLFYKAFSQYYDITPKQLIETIRRDHMRRKKNS